MSNIKELIRQKIDAYYAEYKAKFHQNGDSYHLGIIDGLDMAKQILDTLPDESEQPTRGYDEAYLDEKIAKASKSWEGVDVDKFMDEVRGREKPVTDCHDLTEAAEKYADLNCHNHVENETDWNGLLYAFKAGAEWQKRKMMEGAVEGVVNHGTAVSYVISDEDQLDKRIKQFQNDAEVRIIILPKDAE